jgi:ubiquinone/menaquinone biosynthesis C-methylase UbiE
MNIVLETLSDFSKLERINLWLYMKIKPYLGKRIFEAGCGNGNLTSYMVSEELVVAVDNDEAILNIFKDKYSKYTNLKMVKYNLEDSSVIELSKYSIDTIVCINTLEHLKNDVTALNNFHGILKEGNLILLVPAFQSLYGSLDKALGHYRRYEIDEISEKIERCGFVIIEKMCINFFGIIGWFLNGKILKKERLPTGMLVLSNFMLPLLNSIENFIGPPIGLSYIFILICRKVEKS